MKTLAAIYNVQSNVDAALKSLYAQNIADEKVTIMRNVGNYGDSVVESNDARTPQATPIALNNPNSGLTAAGPSAGLVVATGIDDMNISDRKFDYYRKIADSGAVIIFVEVEDDAATSIQDQLTSHNAQRVDIVDS